MDIQKSLIPNIDRKPFHRMTYNEGLNQIEKFSHETRYAIYFKNALLELKGKKYMASAIDTLSGKIYVIFKKRKDWRFFMWNIDNKTWKEELNTVGDTKLRKVSKDFFSKTYKIYEGHKGYEEIIYSYQYSLNSPNEDRIVIYDKEYKVFQRKNSSFQQYILVDSEDLMSRLSQSIL